MISDHLWPIRMLSFIQKNTTDGALRQLPTVAILLASSSSRFCWSLLLSDYERDQRNKAVTEEKHENLVKYPRKMATYVDGLYYAVSAVSHSGDLLIPLTTVTTKRKKEKKQCDTLLSSWSPHRSVVVLATKIFKGHLRGATHEEPGTR